jgi:hypothetical protein
MEKCMFCNSTELLTFSEHWTFCKDCSAIYTDMMKCETHCEHIKSDTKTVDRLPWFKSARTGCKEAFIKDDKCSICGKTALADGW